MSVVLLGLAAACAPSDRTDPGLDPEVPSTTSTGAIVDVDQVMVADPSAMPAAVFGGTLTPSLDGTLALAAEPARDRLHVVDLAVVTEAPGPLTSLALEAGDQPWRSVAVPGGWVVSLRGGAVLRVDEDLRELWRVALPEPRGLDVGGESVWVATLSGALVELDVEDGAIRGETQLLPDLRDVVVAPTGDLYVSRFRAATVLRLRGLEVIDTFTPPAMGGFEARVAWRLTLAPDGTLVLLSQMHGTGTIENIPPPSTGSASERTPRRSGGYASAAPPSSSAPPTGVPSEIGAVTPQIATFGLGFTNLRRIVLPELSLAVDVAAFGAGSDKRFLVATTGVHAARLVDRSGQVTSELPASLAVDDETGLSPFGARGLVTSVAFGADGQPFAQSAGDSRVFGERGLGHVLSDTPAYDGGRVLFHERQETGLACASCHPEGSDDGHVWEFLIGGPRRTQPLGGGLADSAPFHWDGSVPSLTAIVRHNMDLMGGIASELQVRAVSDWMDALPADYAGTLAEPATLSRGEAIFEAEGCGSCHAGARLSDGLRHRLRGVALDTPSLRGVALREALFHDGCVPSLDALGTLDECRDGVHDLEGRDAGEREDLKRFVASR
ncbi:MAG: hypothetical protein AAGH15_01570 [Myxococcota bacterium]